MTLSPHAGPSRAKRSLGDMLDAIPTQVDSIPDSCSEASSEDEEEITLPTPRPIPLTPLVTQPRGLAGLKGKGKALEMPRLQNQVEASMGRNGRLVYQVTPSNKYAEYYAVQWRKPQQKKTWDGDAHIKVEGTKITMIDENGECKATGGLGDRILEPDVEFRLGNLELCIDCQVTEEVFKSSTTILNRPKPPSIAAPTAYRATTFAKPFKAPTPTHKAKPVAGYIPARTTSNKATLNSPLAGPSRVPLSSTSKTPPPLFKPKAIPADKFYAATPKKPGNKIILGEKNSKERMQWGGALHDPKAEGAVVMKRPPEKWAKVKGTEVVDVVLDPILGSIMRDHQKEGVKFMYECVMGLTGAEAEGCILADDMGLGKTLQTIALIHTLLRQSPFANQHSVIKKALVVCPVTVVDNWRKEFRKWSVGSADLGAHIAEPEERNVGIITWPRAGRKSLTVSYNDHDSKKLKSCVPPIDLIVCDEGQRLKSKDNKNKTIKMFDELRTVRRVILSGTPIQNQLAEYWAMANFTCPGILGKYNAFNKQYEKPIIAGRAVGASAAVVQLGEERAAELTKVSKEFVLRREANVMQNFLPPKNEYVVFVAPSQLQLSVLESLLNPSIVSGFIRGYGAQSLALIDLMRKISNSPMLLKKKDEDGIASEDLGTAISAAKSAIPLETNVNDVNTSGKMVVLDKMLHSIWNETKEKVVVVSNWTSTLNLIQDLMKIRKYPYVRLDGSTPQKQRQDLVDTFNRDVRREEAFVFLLSAKAGGIGLNLIGGSRLFLFDSDWNPSTDLQAMARIHRDGQKRPVYIYRLLTTNAIDEKIYQRQITKMGLSEQMMDQGQASKESKDSFSSAELKDIFTLKTATNGCQTHDLLGCDCIEVGRRLLDSESTSVAGDGVDEYPDNDDRQPEKATFVNAANYDPEPTPRMLRKAAAEQRQKLQALRKWTHFDGYNHASFRGVTDNLLYNLMYGEWDSDEAASKSPKKSSAGAAALSATSDLEDAELDEEAEDRMEGKSEKNKKKRRKVQVGSDDGQEACLGDSVPDSADEAEDDADNDRGNDDEQKDGDHDQDLQSANEDSNNESPIIPSKRKSRSSTIFNNKNASKAASKTKSKVKRSTRTSSMFDRDNYDSDDQEGGSKKTKHDLVKIAERGHAGRIMFVFEKMSKARLG
ncbi:hypothetical protein I317_04798 [Kwoniella heveanensis CBS 569]|nr:hypothetical protein I317_04798 [Kwoniella heveanensis CBS 569]